MNKWTKTDTVTWTNEAGWTIVKADVRGFSIYDQNDNCADELPGFGDYQFSTLGDAKKQVKIYAAKAGN